VIGDGIDNRVGEAAAELAIKARPAPDNAVTIPNLPMSDIPRFTRKIGVFDWDESFITTPS
jgi:hypothetical protein